MTDIGLCLVLQTRPGLAPPQICLPSTLSGAGQCLRFRPALAGYVDPRFCRRFIPIYRGFLQACIAALPLPSATLRLRPRKLSGIYDRLGMDFVRYLCHNTGHHQLAAGPCPAHNQSFKRTLKTAPLNSTFLGYVVIALENL